jgi:hypothetical protein
MFLTMLEFAVVTLGVKFLLGAALIYYLFPADGRCAACDGETVPLQAARGLRWLSRASKVERRMCLGCGGTMVGRRCARPPRACDSADRPRVGKAA